MIFVEPRDVWRPRWGKPTRNLKGRVFGRLTVLCKGPPGGGNHQTQWLCRCECGNESYVRAHNLLHGTTRSCGCLAIERARAKLPLALAAIAKIRKARKEKEQR